MRLVEEIPHTVMKVTIYSWNEKYILKFEDGPVEQLYKIRELDITGYDEVKSLAQNIDFQQRVYARLAEMRNDLHESMTEF